jgi:integrase
MNALSHKFDNGVRSSVLKAPNTVTRYRRACRQFFEDLVRREMLETNPWPIATRGKKTRKETTSKALRVDLLPTVEEAREALDRLVNHQPTSRAFHLVCNIVFYAGLRPSEARALRIEKCNLPREGWGEAMIEDAAKFTGKPFVLDGDEAIGPPKTVERSVPLPPILVGLIRAHVGDRSSGIICAGKGGDPVDLSRLDRAWRRARGASNWRIYDLRHAHATIALRAGVPAVEVARRLGHSVEVLHSVYERAMPGDTSTGNALIETAFS